MKVAYSIIAVWLVLNVVVAIVLHRRPLLRGRFFVRRK